MLEPVILILILSIMLFIVFILWGMGKEYIGKISSEKESAEKKVERSIRAMEKLVGPRPSRSLLIKRWERRMREASGGSDSASLSGSERRSDSIPKE